MKLELDVTSTAFARGAPIPALHTCDGADRSPPLAWSAGPEGTVSYALVMDDPDAPGGTWVHWVAWNLPANRVAENVPKRERVPDGTRQGKNSWGKVGYGGPCPPSGEHRYFFRVFALDGLLELPATTDKSALLAALAGRVLAKGETFGVYTRAKAR